MRSDSKLRLSIAAAFGALVLSALALGHSCISTSRQSKKIDTEELVVRDRTGNVRVRVKPEGQSATVVFVGTGDAAKLEVGVDAGPVMRGSVGEARMRLGLEPKGGYLAMEGSEHQLSFDQQGLAMRGPGGRLVLTTRGPSVFAGAEGADNYFLLEAGTHARLELQGPRGSLWADGAGVTASPR